MESNTKETEIFPNYLQVNKYSFSSDIKYKYINVDSLNPKLRNEILQILKDNNYMPKSFLEFIFEICLNKLDEIYNSEMISLDTLNEYEERKFGLLVKINENEETAQQLVLYGSKNKETFEQFSLIKKIINQNHKIIIDNEQGDSKDEEKITFDIIKPEPICNYPRREGPDMEIYEYFKKKITFYKTNRELSDVFYTLEDNELDIVDKSQIFYYNDFFSVYSVKHRVKFDGKIKIRFFYENANNEITFEEDVDNFEIKKRNLVFIETDTKDEFADNIENFLIKVRKFRDIYDYIYGTENFGTIIYYLYQELDAFSFQESINTAIKNCLKENYRDVDKYTICVFYMNDKFYSDSSCKTNSVYLTEDDSTVQLMKDVPYKPIENNTCQITNEKPDENIVSPKNESNVNHKETALLTKEMKYIKNEIEFMKNEMEIMNNDINYIKNELFFAFNKILEKNNEKEMIAFENGFKEFKKDVLCAIEKKNIKMENCSINRKEKMIKKLLKKLSVVILFFLIFVDIILKVY